MSNKLNEEKIKIFLSYFPNCVIQFFDDDKQRQDIKLAETISYFNLNKCETKQKDGCGVYFSVNGFKDGKRKKENLKNINGVFIDLDIAKEKDNLTEEKNKQKKEESLDSFKKFYLPPHFVIETKNGLQAIWLTEDLMNEDEFSSIQNSLIKKFNSDKGAKNINQVLRLPGFNHLKNPKQPFECFLSLDEARKPIYKKQDFRNVIDEANKIEDLDKADKQQGAKINKPSEEIKKVLDLPIKEVIKIAGGLAGIKVEFTENSDGSNQIIENGKKTSGFISSKGDFVYSPSENGRNGNQITVAEYYINKRGRNNFDRQEIAKIILNKKYPDTTAFSIVSIRDFIKRDIPKPGFLVDDLLPDIGISMIVGKPGGHKTWLTFYIILCITTGRKVFNLYKTKEANVLLVNIDDYLSVIQERMKNMGFTGNENIHIWDADTFKIEDENTVKKLNNFIKEKNISLLIFDAFRNIHSRDENLSDEMEIVLQILKQIAKVNNCAILLLHHENKTGDSRSEFSLRGSSAIIASLTFGISLKKNKEEIKLHIFKNKLTKIIEPINIKMLGQKAGYAFEIVKVKEKIDAEKLMIKIQDEYENKNLKLTKNQFIQHFFNKENTSKSQIKKLFELLVKDKILVKDGNNHKYNEIYYIYNRQDKTTS
ncbi:MAG: AAA family ATPase [Patescibacteria group bacterium]|jgi:hypothetical protein